MQNRLDPVELLTAYAWYCDACGELNFGMPEVVELTDEQAEAAYRKHHDLEEWAEMPGNWRQFNLVQTPNVVICMECCASFEVREESE